jgi:hypothetical protein
MEAKPKSTSKFLIDVSLFFLVTIAILGTASGEIGKVEPDGKKGLQTPSDVEIRFAFSSISPNMDDSSAPLFIAIGRDGRARAVRYQLRYQTKPVASHEGLLPEAEVQRLFARVRIAFRLPKHRKDYDRKLIYESDSFYLGVRSDNGKVREMFGDVETRPEEVRALMTEMTELWKRLSEVPPSYAYLTTRPVEKDRLRRLKREDPFRLTPIESLPAALQSLFISVVTQPLNFYPLTQTQYDEIQTYKRPFTYKGAGYELTLILSSKEAEPQNKGVKST